MKFSESAADSQVICVASSFLRCMMRMNWNMSYWQRGCRGCLYDRKDSSFQIQNLLVAYKERFDKDNFIKNLLLDNLLLVDIYNRAKKLHIEIDVKRIVFIIETRRRRIPMHWRQLEPCSQQGQVSLRQLTRRILFLSRK